MNSKSQSTSTDQETTAPNAGGFTTCGLPQSMWTKLKLAEKSLVAKKSVLLSSATSLSDEEIIKLAANYLAVSELCSQVSDLIRELSRCLELEQFRRTHKLQIGGVVFCNGSKYRVTTIRSWGKGEKPWAKGFKQKVDGTWSKVETNLFMGWTA